MAGSPKTSDGSCGISGESRQPGYANATVSPGGLSTDVFSIRDSNKFNLVRSFVTYSPVLSFLAHFSLFRILSLHHLPPISLSLSRSLSLCRCSLQPFLFKSFLHRDLVSIVFILAFSLAALLPISSPIADRRRSERTAVLDVRSYFLLALFTVRLSKQPLPTRIAPLRYRASAFPFLLL